MPLSLGVSGLDHSTEWMWRDDSERDFVEDWALVGWTDVGPEGWEKGRNEKEWDKWGSWEGVGGVGGREGRMQTACSGISTMNVDK